MRSPPADVVGEEEIVIEARADGGPPLGARVRVPHAPLRAVVLAHPHPLYGGSMHSPVVLSIARVLAEKRTESVATLTSTSAAWGRAAGRTTRAAARSTT